ncbi:hypothetical protein C9J44_21250, partial [Photobacterium sp. GB-27]|uniref:glycosyltransferase n=1 Tax=Photobacterium sp. GB-27 TaxID=2022109 RepID=UPI000D179509
MKVYWVLGSSHNSNSGVSKYSESLIRNLKEKEIDIDTIKSNHEGLIFYLWKYFYLPIYLLVLSFYNKKSIIVFPDESYAFNVFSCFYFNKKIIIVHDYREIKSVTIKEKIKHVLMSCNYKLICRFDKVFTASEFTKTTLLEHNLVKKEMVITCYNIVEPSLNFECSSENYNEIFKNSKKSKNFIYVGSHETRKNTLILAEIFKKNPDINLFVVGKVVDYQNYDRFLAISENCSNIHCLGEVDDSSLSYLIKKSDFLINISSFEGFGRTPIEAQYLSTPVISTRNTGLNEVLSENSFI